MSEIAEVTSGIETVGDGGFQLKLTRKLDRLMRKPTVDSWGPDQIAAIGDCLRVEREEGQGFLPSAGTVQTFFLSEADSNPARSSSDGFVIRSAAAGCCISGWGTS